jgi:hypothetical protein
MLTEQEFAALIVRSFTLDARAAALDSAAKTLGESLFPEIERQVESGEVRQLLDQATVKAAARGAEDPVAAAVGVLLIVQARRVAAFLSTAAASARVAASSTPDAPGVGAGGGGEPEGPLAGLSDALSAAVEQGVREMAEEGKASQGADTEGGHV